MYGGYLYSQPSLDSVLREMSKIDKNLIYDEALLVNIPGTSIKMIGPEHFMLSEKVPGFIHIGTSSSIQVNEIKGTSYIMIEEAMTEDAFKKQNVKFLSKSEVELHNGTSGVLYLVEFEVEKRKYERMMLFAGDYHRTMWINASYPLSTKELIQEILLSSILTAQFE